MQPTLHCSKIIFSSNWISVSSMSATGSMSMSSGFPRRIKISATFIPRWITQHLQCVQQCDFAPGPARRVTFAVSARIGTQRHMTVEQHTGASPLANLLKSTQTVFHAACRESKYSCGNFFFINACLQCWSQRPTHVSRYILFWDKAQIPIMFRRCNVKAHSCGKDCHLSGKSGCARACVKVRPLFFQWLNGIALLNQRSHWITMGTTHAQLAPIGAEK